MIFCPSRCTFRGRGVLNLNNCLSRTKDAIKANLLQFEKKIYVLQALKNVSYSYFSGNTARQKKTTINPPPQKKKKYKEINKIFNKFK